MRNQTLSVQIFDPKDGKIDNLFFELHNDSKVLISECEFSSFGLTYQYKALYLYTSPAYLGNIQFHALIGKGSARQVQSFAMLLHYPFYSHF